MIKFVIFSAILFIILSGLSSAAGEKTLSQDYHLILVSGNLISGPVNTTLLPYIVRAETSNGMPAPNVTVYWTIVSAPVNAILQHIPAITYTDEHGIARNSLHLGERAGEYRVNASLGTGENITFYSFAEPGTVAKILIRPHTLSLMVGDRYQLYSEIFDAFGNPVYHATLNWSVDGLIGNISSNGIFIALNPGRGRIVVTSGNVSGICHVLVTADARPPSIIGCIPCREQQKVPLSTVILLTFSEPMNRSSVEKAFSIEPNLRGTFSWNGNILIYHPVERLQQLTNYKIVLNASMATDAHNNMLDGNEDGIAGDNFVLRFNTTKFTPPRVVIAQPTGFDVSERCVITVMFSEYMNRSTAERAFALLVAGVEVWGVFDWNESNTLVFIPNATLIPGKQYTVLIHASATDIYGNRLDTNGNNITDHDDMYYMWSFVTAPEKPEKPDMNMAVNIAVILVLICVLISIRHRRKIKQT